MTSADEMPFKLGRLPAMEDPRTLRLAAYTGPGLEPAPPSSNWLSKVQSWPLYNNNRIGDCVAVSCAHAIQGWTAHASSTPVQLAESDVIAAYSAVSGFDPGTGANDDGCRYLDMLNHWRHNGIGGRKIVAYVEVNVDDREEVRVATHLFGGLMIGIDMPLSAGTQLRLGQTWRPGFGAAGQPNSWGGHAAHLAAYNSRWLTCTTWGATQRMSWPFFDTYVREGYAAVSADWLDPDKGVTPTGLHMDALLADLQRITAN